MIVRLCRSGQLAARKVGRGWRIPVEAVSLCFGHADPSGAQTERLADPDLGERSGLRVSLSRHEGRRARTRSTHAPDLGGERANAAGTAPAQSNPGPVTHRSPRDRPNELNEPLAPRIALRLPTRPRCRITSSRNFVGTCGAESSRTDSSELTATRADTISLWHSRARAAALAPAARVAAWPTLRRIWSIACCRRCPFASGCCRCRSSYARWPLSARTCSRPWGATSSKPFLPEAEHGPVARSSPGRPAAP